MTPCIWFWIAAIVIFIIAEAVTVALVSVWFIGGAVCALLAAIFGAPGLAQAAVFVIVSALLSSCARRTWLSTWICPGCTASA